jgi:glycosyltransferase involved in cell wall biosynthesis
LRVLVVVPALNEERSLPGVLEELASLDGGIDVLVVSDGSTDRTAQVARSGGAEVLELPINLGVGGAMRAGFAYAYESGYDAVVQVDADGQHDPVQIARIVEAAAEQGTDVMIGARFAGKGNYQVRGPRRWAMVFLSAVLSRLVGTKLTDTTSGFKLSGPRALAVFAHDYPAEYLGDTIESIVIAHRAGLKIGQIPVTMRERTAGRPSHNPWRSTIFLLRAMLALLIAISRPKPAARAEAAPSEAGER